MTTQAWETWIAQLSNPLNQLEVLRMGFGRMPPQWRIEPRVLNDHLVHYVVQHEVRATIEDSSLTVGERTCLWLNPGIEHSLQAADPKKPPTLVYLRFRLTNGQKDIVGERHPWVICRSPSLKQTFLEMIAELHSGQEFAQQRFRWLLSGLFLLAARQNLSAAACRRTLSSAQCAAIEHFTSEHARRTSLAALAAQARLSTDYFRRVFTRTYGLPPATWLVRRRIFDAAAMLLDSNLTIQEVAHRFDYTDAFQFTRQFKAVMGISPRAYRMDADRRSAIR